MGKTSVPPDNPIPPEQWIPHPVSDHSDLDRPEPVYGGKRPPEEKKN